MQQAQTDNMAIARRFFEEFLGKGSLAVADEVLDENIQAYTGLKPTGPIDGREEYKQVFGTFFDAFPPVSDLAIQDLFATDDRVVCRFKSDQKHTKEFFGVAATNRVITLHETHVLRLRDGKIVENYVSATNLEFEMLMAPVLTPLILK